MKKVEQISGGQVTRHFCPNCGVVVYSLLELHPSGFAATAGSLDNPAMFDPIYALFTVESQSWDPIPDRLQQIPAGLERNTASGVATALSYSTRASRQASW